MATLDQFIGKIKSGGLMQTARYTVIIPDSTNGHLLGLYCDQVQLPGLNVGTSANTTWGESREVPYTRMFDNLTMSFYVDNGMNIKKFFDNWLWFIQNPNDKTFKYYNEYTSSIQVIVEDLEGIGRYSIMLRECYPKTVSAIQLDYASKDIIMKLSVTFAYKYWEPVTLDNEGDSQLIGTNAFGAKPETLGVFNGIASNALGLVENYGVNMLKNKLIGL